MTLLPAVLVAGLLLVVAASPAPSREHCQEHYGNVTLIEQDQMWERGMPALLLSFPGSGNTWVRLLLEYATGFLSSTIYWDHDKELQKVFKAEEKCGLRQIVHKAHPEDLVFRGFMDRSGNEIKGPTALRSSNKHVRRKCDRSFVRHWDKIVLLTRDPYRSILSDYQRLITSSHTGEYDPLQQLAQRDGGSQTPRVSRPRNKGPALTAQDFWLQVATTKAQSFGSKMDEVIYPILRHAHPDPRSPMPFQHPIYNVSMGVIRYEALASKDAATREAELARAVRMLNVSTATQPDFDQRLRCAFVLADDPRIRRKGGAANATYLYAGIQTNLTEELWGHLAGFASNFSYSRPVW